MDVEQGLSDTGLPLRSGGPRRRDRPRDQDGGREREKGGGKGEFCDAPAKNYFRSCPCKTTRTDIGRVCLWASKHAVRKQWYAYGITPSINQIILHGEGARKLAEAACCREVGRREPWLPAASERPPVDLVIFIQDGWMFLHAYNPLRNELARSILLAPSLAIRTVARGGVGVRVCLFGEQTLTHRQLASPPDLQWLGGRSTIRLARIVFLGVSLGFIAVVIISVLVRRYFAFFVF